MTPRPQSLNEWIDAIGRLSVHEMDLGLERVRRVWKRLHTGRPRARVVTIAGTNGKGTCAHFIDRTLRAAGKRTGLYTSPHLLRFNERIRIDGRAIDDADLVRAFERVEQARRTEPLTFFEFTTLAALVAFARRPLDVVILEVGLGGRLDAVNVIDPDVAIVTRIGLDHMDYLGTTLEAIGREKAGIFRRGVPAVVCRDDAPRSVMQTARRVGARLIRRGAGIDVHETNERFDWRMDGDVCRDLPRP
ncbi:MAG: Mur ligase family protein, partial [Pseudomonadota bacterium]